VGSVTSCQVSVVGHSLGSVILWDLLSHQPGPGELPPETALGPPEGPGAGQGQGQAWDYPTLAFPVHLFLTLGSPIGRVTLAASTPVLKAPPVG
jgi:hypothetical protein